MRSFVNPDKHTDGQGLVEYALLLTLVAAIAVATLTLLGASVGDIFCRVTASLDGSNPAVCSVEITKADYDSGDEELHLDATVGGGYDPLVTLTATPGGVMAAKSDHYHLKFSLTGCPCTVRVTSSNGGSASVTVGP